MSGRRALGLAGSVLLFVGVFLPAVSVPMAGSIAYFRGGEADALVVLGLAVLSVFLVVRSLYRGLWLTGAGSIGVVAFTVFRRWRRLTSTRRSLPDGRPEGPLRELEHMAIESVQLEYGLPVMVLGTILLVAAAAMTDASPKKKAGTGGAGEEG